MGKKHKHADAIIAWANGEDIQVKNGDKWEDVSCPIWNDYSEYRIKPKIVKRGSVDMKDCFSKPKDRSIEEILARADWIEEMLIANAPTFDYDWDLVLLADEVKRLKSILGIK